MLLKNTAFFFLGEAFNRTAKFGAVAIIALVMSKREFGAYAFLLSGCLFVLVFLDAGINTMIVMRGSSKKGENLVPLFILTKLVAILFVSIVLFVIQGRLGFLRDLGRTGFPHFTCSALDGMEWHS